MSSIPCSCSYARNVRELFLSVERTQDSHSTENEPVDPFLISVAAVPDVRLCCLRLLKHRRSDQRRTRQTIIFPSIGYPFQDRIQNFGTEIPINRPSSFDEFRTGMRVVPGETIEVSLTFSGWHYFPFLVVSGTPHRSASIPYMLTYV